MKKYIASLLIAASFIFIVPTTHAFWLTDAFEYVKSFFFSKPEPVIEEVIIPDEPSLAELMKEITLQRIQDEAVFEKEILATGATETQPDLTPSTKKAPSDIILAPLEERATELVIDVIERNAPVTQIEEEEIPFPIEIPATFTCASEVKEFNPMGNDYFASLLFGSQNRHTEILRYKIKWFDGTWSNWFTPGQNDQDWQGDRHYWSYFGSHQYKVEHCRNYQYNVPQ